MAQSDKSEKLPTDISPPPELEKQTSRKASIGAANDQTIAILDLVKAQDAHHPIHWPAWKRWSVCVFYCFLQLFVTMTSTSYSEYQLFTSQELSPLKEVQLYPTLHTYTGVYLN